MLRDFAELWPDKFCNVTNGVTPRRFVALSNPGLTKLINTRIGDRWLKHLDRLRQLESLADNTEFQRHWREVKLANKRRLAALIADRTGIAVAPESLFDVLVKRIHEYKRQHLDALHILTLYLRLKHDPQTDVPSRTFIFGGKAAPGYFMAKRIVKLITATGDLVNSDPIVRDRLKVIFFPDFNVKNAHFVYPAADLSEQISTAGKEASGTGNMKFSNGALTIGTPMARMSKFAKKSERKISFSSASPPQRSRSESERLPPARSLRQNAQLREVIDFIAGGGLARGDTRLFRPLVENLLNDDPFLLLADYQSYIDAQERVSALWRDTRAWTRQSIPNTARMGKFSSDRSIRDYCERVWKIQPGWR